MPNLGCWPVPTSSSSWRDVSCGATRQNATTSELASVAALQKRRKIKSELEGVIKQQADQLNEAKHQQETLAKQLDELQQKWR